MMMIRGAHLDENKLMQPYLSAPSCEKNAKSFLGLENELAWACRMQEGVDHEETKVQLTLTTRDAHAARTRHSSAYRAQHCGHLPDSLLAASVESEQDS
jgi:hypothetical protein